MTTFSPADSELVLVIAAAVSAAAAFVSAIIAALVLRENSRLRRNREEPYVIAYLVQDRRQMQVLNFVVTNIGNGIAKDVCYEIHADTRYENDESFRHVRPNRLHKIELLPPGVELVRRFAIGFEALAPDRVRWFSIEINYKTRDGKRRTNSLNIDVGDFEGMFAGNSVEQDILNELRGLKSAVVELSR